MSIIFNPTNNQITLNNKNFDYITKDDSFIDLYNCTINLNDAEALKILDIKNNPINSKLVFIDRRKQKEYILEYKDGIKNGADAIDFCYFCATEDINQEINIEKICLDIYKKYIEKFILIRSNKFYNLDHICDIYIIFSNSLYNQIFENFCTYFNNLIKCSNIKLHLVCINFENTSFGYYTNSCAVC
jgi:hypothetical protein